jgi:hypothetical protein
MVKSPRLALSGQDSVFGRHTIATGLVGSLLLATPWFATAQIIDEEYVTKCKVIARKDPNSLFVLGYVMGFSAATDLAYAYHVGFTRPRDRQQRVGVIAFEFQSLCAENPDMELYQAMVRAYYKLLEGGFPASIGCQDVQPRGPFSGCTRRTIENP